MKTITKITNGFKYFSILCIGAALALIIEYGFTMDFVLILGLSALILCGTSYKLKVEMEEMENDML